MQNTRPTFLGIGAHKAGTSWMYYQLIKHSQIWMPPVKEIHFFDRSPNYPSPNKLAISSPLSRFFRTESSERFRIKADLRSIMKSIQKHKFHEAIWWSKWTFGYYNENWYRSLFSQDNACEVYGEITPSYSILKSADVARIKAINPDLRLLFLIRNPVDRAWSAIRFNVQQGHSSLNLNSSNEIISALKKPSNILRGDYERTLDTYLKHFDSSQILICFYDAIRCDPVGLMSGITTFLNVISFEKAAIDNKTIVNRSSTYQMPVDVRDYLLETYAPMINRLAKTFGSYATIWERAESPHVMESQKEYTNTRLLPTVHP